MKPLNQTGLRWRISRSGALFLALMVAVGTSFASTPLNTACPLGFFTNVASRLLSSQLDVNLNHIQIYPTNQYTPAVHRLLQVTANIYDATTTNYYPSVFRPLFWKTNELNNSGVAQTNIYIIGYQYVQEPLTTNGPAIFILPTEACDPGIPFGLSSNNIYGIPWVIGVKKGLPNFNAFELDNTFFIERKLQFNRNSSAPSSGTFPYGRIYTTNQMYIMGISNTFGIEDWNSYAENYTNPVIVVAQDVLSVGLTNDAPFSVINTIFTNGFVELQPWSGGQFIMPLGTNLFTPQNLAGSFLPPSTNNLYSYYIGPGGTITIGGFSFTPPCFVPLSLNPTNFLDRGTPPLPQFGLSITNHLQAYIIDTSNPSGNYILDYVQLDGMNSSLNINDAIADPDGTGIDSQTGGLWSTNYFSAGSDTPYGVVEQFFVSSIGGIEPTADNDGGVWSTAPVPGAGGNNSPSVQQAFFSAFFSASSAATYGETILTNIQLSIQAPYTPEREIVQRFNYQANDPLVHYLTSDLNDFADDTSNRVSLLNSLTNGLKYIGLISDRYSPWGTFGKSWPAGEAGYDQNACNLAYKDPQVYDADDWNFPTNESLNASWLGQIHRSTPWQTIFLKSTNILDLTETVAGSITLPAGLSTWQLWTGDINPTDAASMAPIEDWHIASLLASLFNTNNYASLFSVNDPNPSDWENLLNGMTVLTNTTLDQLLEFRPDPQFAMLTISSGSSQAATIANNIEAARAALPCQLFMNLGDILSVSQLSDNSPYLNVDPIQVQHGINDEAYEAIPDQLLPLLRVDSIGAVLNANGQMVIQFTGDVNHLYALQVSCDLSHWTTVSTNCPVDGSFTFTNAVTAGPRFYRTILVQ